MVKASIYVLHTECLGRFGERYVGRGLLSTLHLCVCDEADLFQHPCLLPRLEQPKPRCLVPPCASDSLEGQGKTQVRLMREMDLKSDSA